MYSTLLIISSFPFTTGSWASAAFGGGVLVGRCCFGREDYFGSSLDEVANMCACVVVYIICAYNQALVGKNAEASTEWSSTIQCGRVYITYAYMHTCTHTQFHTNRLTADMHYTHTCAYIYTQCHAHSHSRIVNRTLLVISPFPCTMGSWVSAAFGGSALVGKMQFWQGRLLWQLTRWSGQCDCVHFGVWLSTSYVNTTRSFHFTLEPQGQGVSGTLYHVYSAYSLSL